MCTNEERGCEWQGELNDIINHLGNNDGCHFEDVKCSIECGKMLQRRYLTSHVEEECPRRKVDCQYCHIAGEHQFIEGEHKEQCPKLPLPCPNRCTGYPNLSCGHKRRAEIPRETIKYILREDMEAHKKECPLQEVECLFKCRKILQRRYLTSHVEEECPRRKVDCQYCQITGEHQFIEGEHKEQCPKLPLPCPNKCEVGSVPREDMEAHKKECPLEMVQCEYHSVGCEERMIRKDLKKHKEKEMEKHLALTSSQLTTTSSQLATISSQLATALKHIDTLVIALNPAIPQTYTYTHVRSSGSLITDAQRSLNLTAMVAMAKSDQVCPVVISATEFDERKNSKVKWYSGPFYSHDKGYKMCLSLYPAGNGEAKGTHLSVFLYLMKGPHDDELTWPLRGKFEVKLLNQISDCEHYPLAIAYDEHTKDGPASRVTYGVKATGWGKPHFISNENLHKVTPTCQYLKDDCIFLQVIKLY